MDVPPEYFIFKIHILRKVALITLGVCRVSVLLGRKDFALGFFFGGLLSLAIFSLLYRYVLMLRNFQPPKRKMFIMTKALALYFVMAIALFIGIKKGIPVFLGTALGILSLKAAIFMQVFQEKHVSQ